MRIGQVCPYSLTIPGGVQTQVLGLAHSLRRLGHDVRILAPCDGPPPEPGITPLGRSVPLAINGSVAPLAPDPACALRTMRALRDEGFDIAHLHEPMVPGPTHTAMLSHRSPLVGTFHRAGATSLYRYLRPVARFFGRRLDARVAVSADALATAEAGVGGAWDVLFNGVEVDAYAKAEPWPTPGPTIFFVSRHEPRKGLPVLLDAMAHLPADVTLWIASSGPQTPELQARFGGDERIEWLGRISDEEKTRRMRAASVYCAPSLHGESFGVILIEAMAAGTPVVASDIDGYRNVARVSGTSAGGAGQFTSDPEGVLVPPDDPVALAGALRRVLEDDALAARLAAAGEIRANQFSMDTLADRYVEIYHRVLG